MGDIINIEDYYERKVNELAQRYRACAGTCCEKDLEAELKTLGARLARYKTFSMRRERDGIN
jgi:hypothetical protein